MVTKLVIFTNLDAFCLEFINRLSPTLVELGVHALVFDSGALGNRRFRVAPPADLGFFSSTLLHDVVLPLVDACAPNPQVPNRTALQLESDPHFTFLELADVNDGSIKQVLEDYEPPIVSLSYGSRQIFEPPTIEYLRANGFLWNIHRGILPKYKGLLPPFWAMMAGDKRYGWTLHEIDAGIDTGPILAIADIEIGKGATPTDLFFDMAGPGVAMFESQLRQTLTGVAPVAPERSQSGHAPGVGTYRSYPTRALMRELESRGIRLCRPERFREHYVSQYSAPGSAFRTELTAALDVAIDKRESSQPLLQERA